VLKRSTSLLSLRLFVLKKHLLLFQYHKFITHSFAIDLGAQDALTINRIPVAGTFGLPIKGTAASLTPKGEAVAEGMRWADGMSLIDQTTFYTSFSFLSFFQT
jgi:hypothetical protein